MPPSGGGYTCWCQDSLGNYHLSNEWFPQLPDYWAKMLQKFVMQRSHNSTKLTRLEAQTLKEMIAQYEANKSNKTGP
jgi:hypothetical protein